MAKGDFDPPLDVGARWFREVAVSGTDPYTNRPYPREQYLEIVLGHVMGECREIGELVARVVAGDYLAAKLQQQDYDVHRAQVAAVPLDVGTVPRTEAELAVTISRQVSPAEFTRNLRPHYSESVSQCTVVECERFVRHAQMIHARDLYLLTHGYHKPRTQRTAEDAVADVDARQHVTVHTPQDILRLFPADRTEPADQFVEDVVNATQPSLLIRAKEEVLEAALRGVHAMSRMGKRLAGVDLEKMLAARKRGKPGSLNSTPL